MHFSLNDINIFSEIALYFPCRGASGGLRADPFELRYDAPLPRR
jgi:hypothetical protein